MKHKITLSQSNMNITRYSLFYLQSYITNSRNGQRAMDIESFTQLRRHRTKDIECFAKLKTQRTKEIECFAKLKTQRTKEIECFAKLKTQRTKDIECFTKLKRQGQSSLRFSEWGGKIHGIPSVWRVGGVLQKRFAYRS